MALSNKFIEILLGKVKDRIIGAHINKITMLNDTDFFISKSKNCQEKIFISLNAHEPFFTLCNDKRLFSSLSNNFLLTLKKEIEDGLILDFSKATSERIVCLKISNTSDSYKKYIRHLYIELIPNQTNLILCDENDVIIACSKSTSFNRNVRLIARGLKYSLPLFHNTSMFSKIELEQNEKEKQTEFNDLYMLNNVLSVINVEGSTNVTLQMLYEKYVSSMEKSHKKDLYFDVTSCITRNLKSLRKKVNTLKGELRQTKIMDDYKMYGDILLTYSNEGMIDSDSNFVINDYKIPLDQKYSIYQNANNYYQKYAKIKRSIPFISEQISLAEDKILYFELLENQLLGSNDSDIKGIEFELIENGYIKKKILKKQTNKSQGMSKPYYVFYDNVKIGYGKNNFQNNYLTFSLAKPHNIFLHIKNRPGSHVIIFDDNPSKDVIEKAASICLINAKMNDGEIQMCRRKDIKKINNYGKVSLDTYSSFFIKNIDEDFKEKIINNRKD